MDVFWDFVTSWTGFLILCFGFPVATAIGPAIGLPPLKIAGFLLWALTRR
jgi:hypothetical protein